MAGILDFLQSPDAQLGIGLLAAGGPTTDPNQTGFGQRLAGAMNSVTANQQIAMRAKLMQSQIDENAAQNLLRQQQMVDAQRKQAVLSEWAAGGGGPGGSGPDFSPATLARLKLAGADMTDVAKLAQPNWQNINGNLVNTNDPSFKGGIQEGVFASADGRINLLRKNANGEFVSGAPQGSIDTFRAGEDAKNQSAAGQKTMKVWNKETKQYDYETEANVAARANGGGQGGNPAPMAGGRGNVKSVGYADGDRNAANAESIRMIQSEMAKPGNSPADMAGMQREIKRLQMQSGLTNEQVAQGGKFSAEPSTDEQAKIEANRTRAVDTAKADVVRDTGDQKKAKSAGEMIAAVQRARELLKQGPTASGAGEMVDKAAAWIGKSTAGGEVAAKLDIVAGDLLNNVPRMEGPQSDGDRVEYKIQAGRAADRSVPTPQRMAAMDELERLQSKYAKLNGGTTSDAPAPGKSFKDFGYDTPASALKDAQNAMMKNPAAKGEIIKRLQNMGIQLPGATGSW
jgi:hypothetical protein